MRGRKISRGVSFAARPGAVERFRLSPLLVFRGGDGDLRGEESGLTANTLYGAWLYTNSTCFMLWVSLDFVRDLCFFLLFPSLFGAELTILGNLAASLAIGPAPASLPAAKSF